MKFPFRKTLPDKASVPDVKVLRKGMKESSFVFSYVRRYWKHLSAGIFFVMLSGMLAIVFPYMLKQMIDTSVSIQGKKVSLGPMNILYIIIALLFLQMLCSFLRVYFFTFAGEHSLADLRNDLYKRLIQMPMLFFSKRRVGELSSRISADLNQIQDGIVLLLAESLRGAVTLLVGVGFIFFINFRLSLLMLTVVPFIILLAMSTAKKIRRLSMIAQDQLSDSNIIVQETLLGISNVKAYTNEKFEANRFRESVARTVRTAIKSGKVRALFVSMLNFLVYSAIVFIIWYGAWQMHRQTLSFGDLTAFVIYTALVGASMSNLADLYGQLQKIFGAAGRIRELFAQPIEGTIDEIPCSSPSEYKLTGAVELDNVSFYYPSRPDLTVLKNISLKAGKGEKIAVVGPSGAGKTTLVSLLLRFYDPVSGKILFDGIDALSIPLRHLREQIAIIPQDVLLFGGTIRENIAYGRPNVSAEELEEASKKAFAHDFIAGFPEGYDTVVGERGVRLSGGQRQRISIARAILKDARILILDEATSSLDSSSELMVQKAMDALFKDRTAFIIAHRLSTIRNADRIIVIDRGTIKESGTHHELVNEEDSLYRALNELQSQS